MTTEAKQERLRAARRLIRASRMGALATMMAGRESLRGWAYASLATVAWDMAGRPIFLFSRLSDHMQNLMADERASLLIEDASHLKNPQTGPRITLMGVVTASGERGHARRFLAHHPDAREYAGFGDFAFYVMNVDRARFVGGFASAAWIAGRDLLAPEAAVRSLAAIEEDALDHLNHDHGPALDLYATRLLKARGCGWKAVALDPFGLDLARGAKWLRLEFPAPVADSAQLRTVLSDLAAKARAPAPRSAP